MEGYFDEGLINGKMFVKHNQWECKFRAENGVINGNTVFESDKTRIEGSYKHGKKDGIFIVTKKQKNSNRNPIVYRGEFQNGE